MTERDREALDRLSWLIRNANLSPETNELFRHVLTLARRGAGVRAVPETVYFRRCGWCGAYEGTVDPRQPCEAAIDHDAETGEPYVCGPHDFGPYEKAETTLYAAPPEGEEGGEHG